MGKTYRKYTDIPILFLEIGILGTTLLPDILSKNPRMKRWKSQILEDSGL